jgi:hypothetical protein
LEASTRLSPSVGWETILAKITKMRRVTLWKDLERKKRMKGFSNKRVCDNDVSLEI